MSSSSSTGSRKSSSVPKRVSSSSSSSARPLVASSIHSAHFETRTPIADISAPRSDTLAEETAKMEERLRRLKLAMLEEKQRRVDLPKTKDGNYWKAARKVKNDNFVADVLKRIEVKKEKLAQMKESQKSPERLDATLKRDMAASGKLGTFGSQYEAPPNKTKSRLAKTLTPSSAAQQPKPFDVARDRWLGGSSDSRDSARPNDDLEGIERESELGSGAPGNLLDGDFDENEAKSEFQKAREEWLSAMAEAGGSKVELVHSSTSEEGTEMAERANYTQDGGIQVDSGASVPMNENLSRWAGDFDEEANAREFAEARAAFLGIETANNTGTSNSSTESKSNSSAKSSSSDSLIDQSSKFSCYQCYKLFSLSGDWTAAAASLHNAPEKKFCSSTCLNAYVEANSAACVRCNTKFDRKVMKRREEGYMCRPCGQLAEQQEKNELERIRKEKMEKLQQEKERIRLMELEMGITAEEEDMPAASESQAQSEEQQAVSPISDTQPDQAAPEPAADRSVPASPAAASSPRPQSASAVSSPVAPQPVFNELVTSAEPVSVQPIVEIPDDD